MFHLVPNEKEEEKGGTAVCEGWGRTGGMVIIMLMVSRVHWPLRGPPCCALGRELFIVWPTRECHILGGELPVNVFCQENKNGIRGRSA